MAGKLNEKVLWVPWVPGIPEVMAHGIPARARAMAIKKQPYNACHAGPITTTTSAMQGLFTTATACRTKLVYNYNALLQWLKATP